MKKLWKCTTQAKAGVGTNIKQQLGFTLVELVIVIAIVGILTAIAYANYETSVIKSRRKAATTCLMENSQFMERYYTTNLAYHQTPAGTAVVLPDFGCETENAAFYTIQLNGTPTASTYSIEAIPQGNQAVKDSACGTLRINQSGVKSITGSVSTSDVCWNK